MLRSFVRFHRKVIPGMSELELHTLNKAPEIKEGDVPGKISNFEGRNFILQKLESGKLMFLPLERPGTTVDDPKSFYRRKGKKRKPIGLHRSPVVLLREGSDLHKKLYVKPEDFERVSRELRFSWDQHVRLLAKAEQRQKARTTNTRKMSRITAKYSVFHETA